MNHEHLPASQEQLLARMVVIVGTFAHRGLAVGGQSGSGTGSPGGIDCWVAGIFMAGLAGAFQSGCSGHAVLLCGKGPF